MGFLPDPRDINKEETSTLFYDDVNRDNAPLLATCPYTMYCTRYFEVCSMAVCCCTARPLRNAEDHNIGFGAKYC